MFSLVSVLIALKHCHLQVQNLDQIIAIINNWPNDPCQNCTSNANLKDYLKVEIVLVEENYELIKGAKFFKELQVDEDQVINLNPKPKSFSFCCFCPINQMTLFFYLMWQVW